MIRFIKKKKKSLHFSWYSSHTSNYTQTNFSIHLEICQTVGTLRPLVSLSGGINIPIARSTVEKLSRIYKNSQTAQNTTPRIKTHPLPSDFPPSLLHWYIILSVLGSGISISSGLENIIILGLCSINFKYNGLRCRTRDGGKLHEHNLYIAHN